MKRSVLFFASVLSVIIMVGVAFVLLQSAPALLRPSPPPITIGIAPWFESANADAVIAGFKETFREAGYREDINVRYDTQNAFSDSAEQRRILQYFADQDVDLLFSLTTPGTIIAKELITDIPIVFSLVAYPKENDLIASNQRSENNLVGTRSVVNMDLQFAFAKRLPLSFSHIGFVHRGNEPNALVQKEELERLGAEQGFTVVDIAGNDKEALATALTNALASVDVLYFSCDSLVGENGIAKKLLALATPKGVPAISCVPSAVKDGAVFGLVTDFPSIGRIAGQKAIKILQGADPSTLETNTSIRPLLLLNRTAANTLGITLPADLLARAALIYDETTLP